MEEYKGKKLGTKVEIKNINSFKRAEEVVDVEEFRQALILDLGGKVIQATLDHNRLVEFPEKAGRAIIDRIAHAKPWVAKAVAKGMNSRRKEYEENN